MVSRFWVHVRKILCTYLPLAALLTALCAGAFGSFLHKNDPAFEQINSIVLTLSSISGLSEEHHVPYGRMNKNQLRKFLGKRIRKTLKPEEIHADELALKMFGLVPQDFDLKKSTIELLTEQAAAFYDYDAKRLFLLEGESFSDEVETLAHELAHALADQHFNLGKYIDDTGDNDDANLARTAVVEGQASWLMMAYALKVNGKPPEPTKQMLQEAFADDSNSSGEFPVLASSPLYIKQSLLFPYADGTMFFNAVYRKEGKAAFGGVFTNPPADTAQIIHPERYFKGIKSTRPRLPKLPGESDRDEINSGVVGEFDHEVLLWQYGNETKGKEVAAHVRGGDFRIVSEGEDHNPVLVYASEWDSSESAERFFGAYEQVLRKKWKGCEATINDPDLFAGHGDDGYFLTTRSGATVTSIEGIETRGEWHKIMAEQAPAHRNTTDSKAVAAVIMK